jgi:hypothetical protein
VVAAGLCVVVDPVLQRHAGDELEAVLGVAVGDALADHVAVVGTADQLLDPTGSDVLEAVDPHRPQQSHGIQTAQEQLWHVVGLVEEDRRLPPGALLVAPVRELGRDRHQIRAVLRVRCERVVVEVGDEVRDSVQLVLQRAHLFSPAAAICLRWPPRRPSR